MQYFIEVWKAWFKGHIDTLESSSIRKIREREEYAKCRMLNCRRKKLQKNKHLKNCYVEVSILCMCIVELLRATPGPAIEEFGRRVWAQ